MSSKILGPESSYFAEMAVNAVTAVKTESGGDAGKKVTLRRASSAPQDVEGSSMDWIRSVVPFA